MCDARAESASLAPTWRPVHPRRGARDRETCYFKKLVAVAGRLRYTLGRANHTTRAEVHVEVHPHVHSGGQVVGVSVAVLRVAESQRPRPRERSYRETRTHTSHNDSRESGVTIVDPDLCSCSDAAPP